MPYHINEKGEPGLCKAERQCPFGNDNEHYDSPAEARAAYEQAMTDVPELAFKAYNRDVVQEMATTTDREEPLTEEELASAPEDPENPGVPEEFADMSIREIEEVIEEHWSEAALDYYERHGRRMPAPNHDNY